MTRKYNIEKGSTYPLGATLNGNRTNFSLYASSASQVEIHLFEKEKKRPFLRAPMYKSAEFWHISIGDIPKDSTYGYQIDGAKQLVHDPYAYDLNTTLKWNDRSTPYHPLGRIPEPDTFDWEQDMPPNIPIEELIIYEMHVRGFTHHKSSKVKHPGTFLGIIEKIPYLKSLGINAIELLPCFEFNECETPSPRVNFWGYSTVNFFTPMRRFLHASKDEFKMLVKALHKAGIEILLDVVFNHTAEPMTQDIAYSFKEIDKASYYLLDKEGTPLNFSGTGNTINCNHPIARKLILDALRYWVQEMHVDGFRFDLASILTRGEDGTPQDMPPLILDISHDPMLANTKLIAEAWDAAGLYQVGEFPKWGRWYEWNGKYRDAVRRFIKGTDAAASPFATALCGSQDLYGKYGKKTHSINFITAHDGFTLHDLVSYNTKHNEANLEENRDGESNNESWNCGAEGKTAHSSILELRERQIRNFLFTLMVSIGTPMTLMGDEYGHTKEGNNNPWCQDNALNWFLWDINSPIYPFYKQLIEIRKTHRILQSHQFLDAKDIVWHGHMPHSPNWAPDSRFVACTLKKKLYIAFNASHTEAAITLPATHAPLTWHLLIDTKYTETKPAPLSHNSYTMKAHSALLLESRVITL